MVSLQTLVVAMSLAETLTIPLASMSNVTWIWGIPIGAGGIPVRRNLPRLLLSAAMALSPCNTWISTSGWLSSAVVNVSVRR